MSPRQVVIAGDSHSFCLGALPPTAASALGPLNNGDPRFLAWLGPAPRDDAYWAGLPAAGAGRDVAIFWHGNQHNAAFLFASSPPFDFIIEGLPNEDGALLAPQATLRAYFEPSFAALGPILENLKASPGCRTALCGTPPPKANDQRLREYLGCEQFFVQYARDVGASLMDIPLTPPRLRLKLWRLLQVMMQEIAARHGISFIPIPASATTGDGFLADAYWAHDATHANEAYGALMRDEIARSFAPAQSREPEAAGP